MNNRKRNVFRSLILGAVFGVLAWVVWQKVRINIWIQMSPMQALLTFLVIGFGLFLLADHLLNRE